MESIECHLSGGFTDRLGSEGTTHLTKIRNGLVELCLAFTENPVERFPSKIMLLKELRERERSTKMHAKVEGSVSLRLATQGVIATIDDEVLHKVSDGVNDIGGFDSA